MRRCWRSWGSAAALLVAACGAPRAGAAQQPAGPLDLPPAGFGTLRQDQVGVRLQTASLAIRVMPLDERVIRLLAPDAYRSLRELTQSRAADVAAAARAAGRDSAARFRVTFFSLQPEARFSPDELYLSSQNTFYRPLGIVPVTPRWSEYIVDQRQQAVAFYLFEPTIPILRPFAVSYAGAASTAWESSLRLLDAERSRALARAQQQGQPTPE